MIIKTIKLLPIDQFRVINQIIIVSENYTTYDTSIGFIYYSRELNSEYTPDEHSLRLCSCVS
jgi:hypothetical protein